MANKATPRKRKAKQEAADKGKVERGVKATRTRRAKTGTANGQREDAAPSNVTRATVEEYASKIFSQQKRVTEVADELKTERAELSGYYKSAKNEGVNIEAIKAVGKMRKRDSSEIRAEQRDVRRYLSILAPEHAKQLDMFVTWGDKTSDPDAEGFAAYKNEEPQTNSPYPAGSEDAQKWQAGWMRAQVANIRTMGPGAATGNDTVQ